MEKLSLYEEVEKVKGDLKNRPEKGFDTLCEFLKANSVVSARYRMFPFFEVTWLMLSYNVAGKEKGQALLDLVVYMDSNTGFGMSNNYKEWFAPLIKAKTAVDYRTFRGILLTAREGKPVTGIHASTYKKLLNMFVWLERTQMKKNRTLWADMARLTVPWLIPHIEPITEKEMANDVRIRPCASGKVGGYYTPFISACSPTVSQLILLAIHRLEDAIPKSKLAERVPLNPTDTVAMFMATAKVGMQNPAGTSQAVHLRAVLEGGERLF